MVKLVQLFEEERERRKMSYREVAREVGLSHTTLVQLKDGKPLELDTVIILCNWLGIPVTAIFSDDENANTYAAIATVLKTAPELQAVFVEAAQEVSSGNLPLSDFKQIVDFAAFVITKRKEEVKRGSVGSRRKDNADPLEPSEREVQG